MIRFQITGVVKYLLGILLLQGATGVLVVAALRVEGRELWIPLGLIGLMLGLLASLWFVSIASHAHRDEINQMQQKFLREREKIRVKAEQEKNKLTEKSHQRILRDRRRTQGKANTKVNATMVGALGLGAVMLFTQFVTMGMLLMTTAGGALAGYAYRTRQEIGRNKQRLALESNEESNGDANDAPQRLPKPPEKLIGSGAPVRRVFTSLMGKKREAN